MGNRSSISFRKGDSESVALFNHWGGEEFQREAEDWLSNFIDKHPPRPNSSDPFSRADPETLMVQFIQSLDKENHSIYLGKDEHDGDNSNHGHLTIHVEDYQ